MRRAKMFMLIQCLYNMVKMLLEVGGAEHHPGDCHCSGSSLTGKLCTLAEAGAGRHRC